MKKIILTLLLIASLTFSFSSVEAEDSASTQILFQFDKLSYNEGDLIHMTIHVEHYADLYGFQVDMKDTLEFFSIPENQASTYYIEQNYIFTSSDLWLNTKSDGIGTAIVSRPLEEPLGFDFTTNTNLVNIALIAENDISDIYDAFIVSNDYDDMLFNGANTVVKLSDSSGEPMDYIYVRDEVGPDISGNTDLTFDEDTEVYDLLVGLEYTDAHHFNDEDIVVRLLLHDFDIATPGEYSIEIQLTNKYFATSSHFRNILVVDTTNPTFTLAGDNPYIVDYGSVYEDPGVICIDNSNENCIVEVVGTVDTSTFGTYTVTINVTDQTGNAAESTTRTVIIEDISSPEYEVLDQVIEKGVSDIDWTTIITNVADNHDTVFIMTEVTDTVDYNTVGTYEVTVKVGDQAGNESIRTFNVTVEDTTAPVIEGVEDNKSYSPNTELTITFNEGTAILNDEAFDSGTKVTASGSYELAVTDISGNQTVISFQIEKSFLPFILGGIGLVVVVVPVVLFRRKIFGM